MLLKKIVGKRILAGLLATGFLVACASPTDAPHAGHHAGPSAGMAVPGQAGASPMQGGMAGGATTQGAPCCGMMAGHGAAGPGGMRNKDKEAMCAIYRGMHDAPNEQARQAMMERHMPAMSPEMRQHHMDMMRQHCR